MKLRLTAKIHNAAEDWHKKYNEVWLFSEGLAKVKLNDKWGFVDFKTGKEVVPPKYDWLGVGTIDVREGGLARVKLNGKWGYVNKEGEEVIPPKYDEAYPFHKGLAAVELNGKCGFINTEGKEVIPLDYDSVGSFKEGLAEVKLNGKWGLINTKGEEVVPLEYTYTSIEALKAEALKARKQTKK